MLTLAVVLTKKLGLADPAGRRARRTPGGGRARVPPLVRRRAGGLPDPAAGRRRTPALPGPRRPEGPSTPLQVALTADGREAEIATPPLALERGAPAALDRLLAIERSRLAVAVAPSVDCLTGFSTHVNVSVPDARRGRGRPRLRAPPRRRGRHDRRARVERRALREGATWSARGRGRVRRGRRPDRLSHLRRGRGGRAVRSTASPPSWPEPEIVASREKFGWFLPPTGSLGQVLREGRADPSRRHRRRRAAPGEHLGVGPPGLSLARPGPDARRRAGRGRAAAARSRSVRPGSARSTTRRIAADDAPTRTAPRSSPAAWWRSRSG